MTAVVGNETRDAHHLPPSLLCCGRRPARARHMEADTAGNLPTQIYGQLTTRPFSIYGPILSKDRVAVCNLARDLAILTTGVLYERNLLDIPQ